MSEWQNKSDFEINLAVAKLMPPIISENQSASLKIKSSSVLVNDIVNEWEFNPCNSASDAWPLIAKMISTSVLMFSSEGVICHAHPLNGLEKDIESLGGNALRNFMIVYLEMNGVKP